jgi:hypothetical protein
MHADATIGNHNRLPLRDRWGAATPWRTLQPPWAES